MMESQSYLILVIKDKCIITAETRAGEDSANECFDESMKRYPAFQVLMVPTLMDSDYE